MTDELSTSSSGHNGEQSVAGGAKSCATEGGNHILLVEDHEDTGRLIMRLLQNSGYAVDHAMDVRSAVEMFSQTKYDLVLSDLSLPDGSGLDLFRQLRAIRGDVRGICLSGYDSDAELGDSRNAGFAEHLTKPIDLTTLHASVARVIARK